MTNQPSAAVQELRQMEKRNQLSFRVEEDFSDAVEAAASTEDLAVADFVRKLFKLAFAEYQQIGSLHAMRAKAIECQVAAERVVYDRVHKPKNGGKK
jgi:hypothetical protein